MWPDEYDLPGVSSLDERGMKIADTLESEVGTEDALSLLALGVSRLIARYTDELDLGKELPKEERNRAAEWNSVCLDIAHWASPNAGPR